MGQQRRLLASTGLPQAIDHDVDMRSLTVWSSIVNSFEMMLETGNQAIRVIGPPPGGGQFIEVVIDEAPLRQAMYVFSRNLLLVSLAIAILTAALVYLALHFLFVRPMRRLTASLVELSRESRKLGADHRAVESRRRDRRGGARTVRHAARSGIDAASEEQACRARPCGVEDQPRSAQSAGLLATAFGPARQRTRSARAALCAETDALAGARDRVLPVDIVLRPRAGGSPRPADDPDRARGKRGSRIRRTCRRCLDHLDQRDRARA